MEKTENAAPNYSQYSISELKEVLSYIDKDKFPQRYQEAKTVLAQKENKQNGEDQNIEPEEPIEKPAWSEQHILLRAVTSFFAMTCLAIIPSQFYEFTTAKSWTDNTTLVLWVTNIALVITWFMGVDKSDKFKKYLASNKKANLSIAVMPFVIVATNYFFIEKSLPLALHMLSSKEQTKIVMNYKKRTGSKNCRNRVELLETKELDKGRLCLSKAERDRLKERGTITLIGKQSFFGLVITKYRT